MRSYLAKFILIALLLGLTWSCAEAPAPPPPAGPYFVTPETTYLLDSPSYGGNVIGPLFRGDKLDLVEGGDSGWWQVKLQRTGQAGWIRKELLSLTPIATVFYYVKEDTPLLECPRSDCIPLQLLYRGDQVQKIEVGAQGWWRVTVPKGRTLGWVPASALTEEAEAARQPPPRQAFYYVALREITLRAQPAGRAAVIRTLRFNDQVQKIGEAKDWFKVRQPKSGAVGWVLGRDLEPLPLLAPRDMPPKKELRPFKQREEPLTEPEFM